jgi:glycosyltransferase involved in cell wall biosynthesis
VRILYFSKDYTVHDHRILSALGTTDHEIFWLRLFRDSGLDRRNPIPKGITLLEWKAGADHLHIEIKRILDDIKPDLVHAGPVQSCAYPVAMAGYQPLLTMSWGSDILWDAQSEPGRTQAVQTLERTALFACDCETVASAAEELGFPRDKMVVFPWGVDLRHFSPERSLALRSELGWEDAIVLLSTRAHEEIYGLAILIEGFIRASVDHPDLRLLLLNDGSQRGELSRQLELAGLEDRVYCAGTVDLADLPRYYHAADAYVSAARVDGSSISLLEALACGLPSIVSDIPGNQEWIQPGANGWWFIDGDSRSLAEAIDCALSSSDAWESYRANARKIAEERANWAENFEKLLDAYRRVIELRGAGR